MDPRGPLLGPANTRFNDYVGTVAADDAEAVKDQPSLYEIANIDRDRYTSSVTSSQDSTCSQSASVLIPLIAGLPKRISGAMRTGEWGLAGLDALSPGDRAPTSGFEPDHRTVILVPVVAAIEPPVQRGLRHRQETGSLGL
jgi:hypothetical protein